MGLSILDCIDIIPGNFTDRISPSLPVKITGIGILGIDEIKDKDISTISLFNSYCDLFSCEIIINNSL